MNKKSTPLKKIKLDESQTMQAPFVITDEMRDAFRSVAKETAEEYAKRIPEPKIIHPNVIVQCDGSACKSVRDDIGTVKTDICTIKTKANSIDKSLKTISNDLDKRPCLKCVPKELSGFYFRGHHINAGYTFGAFVWLILTTIILFVACCKQQSAARDNKELAIRWHAAYVECNHKYEQLVEEMKSNLPKKRSGTSSKRK